MRSRLSRSLAKTTCALWLVTLSCGSPKQPTTDIEHPPGGNLVATTELPPGLAIRVGQSHATIATDGDDHPRAATATKLSAERVGTLFSRLPALVAETGDKTAFRLRVGSRPPPRTGKTVTHAFPPAPGTTDTPPATAAGALEVVRHLPEGEVPIAPQLSVTFSQPMVAVTSHAEASKTVPVKLEPQPAGHWRWVGTRTILFDPDVRFPQATTYKVTVPAGTRSATGGTLAKAVSWTFSTPPVTLKRSFPEHEHVDLQPLIFAAVDQKIDPEKLLEHVTLVGGGESIPTRLATTAEIAGEPTISNLVDDEKDAEHEGRYLVFRPKRALPKATRMVVTFAAGTPSAEGPRETASGQSFSFSTYGPFSIREAECGWGGECRPRTPWRFDLSNPIDEEAFDPAMVTVKPAVAGLDMRATGTQLLVTGLRPGRTTYQVTVSGKLADTFGQTLGKDQTFSFEVGDPYPGIYGAQGLIAADPAAKKPSYSVFSTTFTKLRVQIRKVAPADFSAYQTYLQKWRYKDPPPLPGTQVFNDTIAVAGSPGELAETAIDLAPALEGGHGHAIVVVDPVPVPGIERNRWPTLHAWVQVTDIGLDAASDSGELVAWTTRLIDGKALAGVNVAFLGRPGQSSDESGIAHLALPDHEAPLLVAQKGNDTAILTYGGGYWSTAGWQRRHPPVALQWYSFDDRGIYKPGERVHFKGWMRKNDLGEGGDIVGFDHAAEKVRYRVTGPRGNDLVKGTVKVTALGGFSGDFQLPKDVNLGTATIHFAAAGGSISGQATHSFQIQEFRRPELEVTSEVSAGPHLVGGHADVAVHARYYSGGPLIAAPVTWRVTSTETHFTPPDRGDYQFGHQLTWFWARRPMQAATSKTETFSGKTDATGTQVLGIDFVSANPPVPMMLTAQAVVADVNRQRWATSEQLLVHPSALYVGLKSKLRFVEHGKPIDIEGIIVDHDGKLAAGAVAALRAVRLDDKREGGQWKTVEVDPQTCEGKQGAKAFSCSFSTTEGGLYRITAQVKDKHGRPSETQIQVYVTGGKPIPSRRVEHQQVKLLPDKDSFGGGDTARVLVAAPFAPAEGLLTIRRNGIVKTRRFAMTEQTITLSIPIRAEDTPNLHVHVDLVGAVPRANDDGDIDGDLPPRPAYASGAASLSIPPVDRELKITVAPKARKLAPGTKSQVAIEVTDASGKPAKGAEVALVVVDEAILALTNHQIGNPLDAFYASRSAGTFDRYFRDMV
ncbi:MAG TPA: Ig-like domain-containing protein, partial [Kofleriaceae bacterium]|nr:Ig-like domain-containing protein [Kofleriaceae bacterium]